jgi:hypothetical protein
MNRRHARPRPARPNDACPRLARTWLICVAAILCCLRMAPAPAAQYDVEVVVFRNLAARDDGEQWPADTGGAAGGFTSIPMQQGVEELPASQFALNDVDAALQRSGAYRVLAHRLWRETAYDSRNAVPYEIYATQDGSRTLEGSIKLIRERYLHLAVDLTLSGSGSLYRLDETRRIRGSELHYFDNPHFGVIARVAPDASTGSPPEEPADSGPPDTVPDEEADTVAQPPAPAR